MGWLWLFVAGLAEVGWIVGLKQAALTGRPWVIAVTAASIALSLGALALALRTLPLGTAYAVWTGLGMVGAVAAGVVLWGETADAVRLAAIALIGAGIVTLRLAS